jgi:hypothetical protein
MDSKERFLFLALEFLLPALEKIVPTLGTYSLVRSKNGFATLEKSLKTGKKVALNGVKKGLIL